MIKKDESKLAYMTWIPKPCLHFLLLFVLRKWHFVMFRGCFFVETNPNIQILQGVGIGKGDYASSSKEMCNNNRIMDKRIVPKNQRFSDRANQQTLKGIHSMRGTLYMLSNYFLLILIPHVSLYNNNLQSANRQTHFISFHTWRNFWKFFTTIKFLFTYIRHSWH